MVELAERCYDFASLAGSGVMVGGWVDGCAGCELCA